MSSGVGSGTTQGLRRDTILLIHMIALSLAGILAIIGPLEVAPFISSVGPPAIWPVIFGYLLFALISVPIFEYTRIVPFAGGYYGLAELGYGLAAGKFTALANYIFYDFWQTTNAFFIAWLFTDTIYLIYHVLPPIWVWLLFAIITLLVTYVMVILDVKTMGNIVFYTQLITLIIVVAFVAYVIARTPYNSTYYLNPLTSTSGWTGIFFATAIMGFWLYVGYGSPLFYTEEAKNATKITWIAIYLSITISAIIIALSAYSEVAAVPLKELSSVASAPIPQLVAWIHYMPAGALLALNMLILAVSLIAYGAGGGSQARLLWAMARDNFIRSSWLKSLSKRNVPANAALLNLVFALATTLILAGGVGPCLWL